MSIAAASNTATFSDLGLAMKPQGQKPDALGQQDFLKLMTTQLTNQDPTKPLDSNEFLGQLAQFSTVSGIQALQASFSSLSASLSSSQSLQAAGLIGRGVLVPSETGFLDGEHGLTGAVEMTGSGDLVVEIADSNGQVVQRLDYGTQPAGLSYFHWDGNDASGNVLPPGQYSLRASVNQGGTPSAASTFAGATVQRVSTGASGITLQLGGLGAVPFSSVREIL